MNAGTKWLIQDAYTNGGESIKEIALRLELAEAEVSRALKGVRKQNELPAKEASEVFRIVLVTYDPEWQKALIAKLRTTPLYLDWRRAVLRRDRYRCQECGNTKGVQVDHIYPLSAIVHNRRINSLEEAAECELIWRVNNGRTLCPTCHKRTETYGAKAQQYWRNDEIDE
ncbi:HNH endonuclease [Fibrella aestuarina]|uniref:HNH endonuclease n=1 Tax=Fibrella aestuarina TaxID=651143 RepID=UPI00059BEB99|nr:HNH endonuclease signature motif containing protein [Fibrella aestuarina]